MKSLLLSFPLLFLALISSNLIASDSVYYELWDISNLEIIGGHEVSTFGDPQVVSTEIGDAVQFDGEGDRLLVDFNPIMDAKEFTVELVFKPDACFPNNTAPRFLHIQDPDDPDAKRVMIELRVDENNMCYMDGFMNTDAGSLTLKDETLVHPTEVWQHVAITYKDSTLTTYFNGVEELSGTLHYSESIVNTVGKTSIGARMNEVKFYSGLIKTLKVTHTKLAPEDFTFIHDSTATSARDLHLLSGNEWLEVFPVPANQTVTVKLNPEQNGGGAELRIFNSSGTLVNTLETDHISEDNLDIDISAEELDAEVNKFMQIMGGTDIKQMKKEWEKTGVLAKLHTRMRKEKTLETALGKVKVLEEMVDRKDLIADN